MTASSPVLHEVGTYGVRALRALAKKRPITIADVMRLARVTMRGANRFLADEVAAEHLTRSGGGPGDAFRWTFILPIRGKARG